MTNPVQVLKDMVLKQGRAGRRGLGRAHSLGGGQGGRTGYRTF